MRKLLSERLKQECNVSLQESILVTLPQQQDHSNSIIHKLNNLGEEKVETMGNSFYPKRYSRQKSERQNYKLVPSSPINHFYEHVEAEKQIEKLIGEKTKAKFQQKVRTASIKKQQTKFDCILQNNRRNYEFPQLDIHKEKQNFQIKIKIDYNRSTVIRNKNLIQNTLSPKCPFCSEHFLCVYKNQIVCCNQQCPSLINRERRSYPLIGVLYDMQMPCCSNDELHELLKKISEQLLKIEESRKSLQEAHLKIQEILDKRWIQDKQKKKREVRSLITHLNQIKKSRLQNQINPERAFTSINFQNTYEQFVIWDELAIKNLHNWKNISHLIEKYKPLCLKQIYPKALKEFAEVTNNYRNTPIRLNVSTPLSYNFTGKIAKLIFCVDGSIQLKPNSFLMITKIQQLIIQFQAKKTSRQLRELLHLLPNADILRMEFDFKAHSHVSSEAFPLLSKFSQKGIKQVYFTFTNARPQFFDDIVAATKCIKNKQKIHINVGMNPFNTKQLGGNMDSVEWGTNLVKNLLKGNMSSLCNLKLKLPISINLAKISQFIINNEFDYLIDLDLIANNVGDDKSIFNVLFEKLRKKKMMLAHIIQQKRKQSHLLNSFPEAILPVYQSFL